VLEIEQWHCHFLEVVVSTLERAIALAASAHSGQRDKAGKPYIFHPIRLMLAVESLEEQLAAILHDVVEDTSVTLGDLRAEGFPDSVIVAVEALTKRSGESRIDAAARAAANPIARRVKLADVRDNNGPQPHSQSRTARLRASRGVQKCRGLAESGGARRLGALAHGQKAPKPLYLCRFLTSADFHSDFF